jgi:hypothetical protein
VPARGVLTELRGHLIQKAQFFDDTVGLHEQRTKFGNIVDCRLVLITTLLSKVLIIVSIGLTFNASQNFLLMPILSNDACFLNSLHLSDAMLSFSPFFETIVKIKIIKIFFGMF